MEDDDVSYGSEIDMVCAYLFVNYLHIPFPQFYVGSHICTYSGTSANIFRQVLDLKEAVLHMIEDFRHTADVLDQQVNFNNLKWMTSITTSKLATSWQISQDYNSIIQKHELYQSATWPRTSKECSQFNYVLFHTLPDESSPYSQP